MEERGMNERIRMLRRQSENAEPRICLERAVLETEAYKKYEGSVSVPEMRALAFLHFMENRKLCISDGELIVGEKGDGPQSAPTFPELCCHRGGHEDHERQGADFLSGDGKGSENPGGGDYSLLGEALHPTQDSLVYVRGVEGMLQRRNFHRIYGAERAGTYGWLGKNLSERLFGL